MTVIHLCGQDKPLSPMQFITEQRLSANQHVIKQEQMNSVLLFEG
jgi:hypothetical protein